jgi:NADH dehydrogenase
VASATGWEVVGLVRSEAAARVVSDAGGRPVILDALEGGALTGALQGATAIVHLAQIGAERGATRYETVNVEGTRSVAFAAAQAGVARLVFFSGLGVAHYGMTPRCTNGYFLSKLAAEALLFRSGLEVAVFRPSYIVGPGDVFVPALVRDMAKGEVERVGDGRFRMQPIAARDAAACVLAAASGVASRHRVFDLVGPEPVTTRALIERVGRLAKSLGKTGDYAVREVSVAEAERQAAAGGYRGMRADELDCMLCDEVSDARPLEALLGRFLTPLDDALAAAVRAA